MNDGKISFPEDDPLAGVSLPGGWERAHGKVREALWGRDIGVLVTTDRVSAYDVVLGEIPGKGAILNQLSLFWLEATCEIIPNHLIRELGPRSVAVKRCRVLPVEVIVRGYLTGSAWRSYQRGEAVSGIILPPGLQEYHRFETPLITPTTKEMQGGHDAPISRDEIIGLGVVDAGLWQQVESVALQLFRRGSEVAAANGLALVDTKYEFGLYDGELHVVDEIHTPDSSRYWYADELSAQLTVPDGKVPRQLDKEFLRDFLRRVGFTGEGTPPELPESVRTEVAERYREIFRLITGRTFSPRVPDFTEELENIIEFLHMNR